jgi:hypothetical protein
VLETGGYKGRTRSLSKTELHSLIANTLGIPRDAILSEYGMSELSSQAYDGIVATSPESCTSRPSSARSPAREFQFPPWTRTRIVSPEDGREVPAGQAGILQVFDMANVFSVSAVQTEDLARFCNDGFELLGRVPLTEPRGCSLNQIEIIS